MSKCNKLFGSNIGTTTLCYSYVAGATKVKERTMAFGLLSFTLSSAFVLGPGEFIIWLRQDFFVKHVYLVKLCKPLSYRSPMALIWAAICALTNLRLPRGWLQLSLWSMWSSSCRACLMTSFTWPDGRHELITRRRTNQVINKNPLFHAKC